ncbi:hypothetical protein [Lactobacillus amylovorus]|uniref:hypothetical protein n=1 Tax=Lactobacillus amylovorus TaxID=1604 RepID=UPI0022DF56DE|nr:hypothetical protein [Lactobacillus amylovorus]
MSGSKVKIELRYIFQYQASLLLAWSLQHHMHLFEPDFLLFLQEDKSEGYIQQQIYIEPKGSYLLETDKWKEEFLKEINDEAIPIVTYVDNNDYHIFGLPFYNTEYKIEEFTESMDNFLK